MTKEQEAIVEHAEKGGTVLGRFKGEDKWNICNSNNGRPIKFNFEKAEYKAEVNLKAYLGDCGQIIFPQETLEFFDLGKA